LAWVNSNGKFGFVSADAFKAFADSHIGAGLQAVGIIATFATYASENRGTVYTVVRTTADSVASAAGGWGGAATGAGLCELLSGDLPDPACVVAGAAGYFLGSAAGGALSQYVGDVLTDSSGTSFGIVARPIPIPPPGLRAPEADYQEFYASRVAMGPHAGEEAASPEAASPEAAPQR
jgi:hypothetical protein